LQFVFDKAHNDDQTSSANEDALEEENSCRNSEFTGDITGGIDNLSVDDNGDNQMISSCGPIIDDKSNDRIAPVSLSDEYDMGHNAAAKDPSISATSVQEVCCIYISYSF